MTVGILLSALALIGAERPAADVRLAVDYALAPQQAAADTQPRIVHGRVLTEGTLTPLPYALVELGSGPDLRVSVTDQDGRYYLNNVPAGPQTIRVGTLDHKPLEVVVQVPEAGTVSIDLILRLSPIGLEGITVVADPPVHAGGKAYKDASGGRGSPADPELRALDSSPGAAELGLADGARSEPRTDPHDPESALYIRGAASDLKLVLLDGAPVYAPFHLGGLLQAFQPDMLASAWLYTGGAPTRYDGGLSYILDLRTRRGPDDGSLSSSGAIDNLGAATRVAAPLGRASLLAGGRVIHRAGVDGMLGDPLPYGYVDGIARIDLDLGAQHQLTATGFMNREEVDLNEAAALEGPANWGNVAGSLRLDTWLAGGPAEFTAAIGEFTTRLPIGVETPGVAEGSSTRARFTADLSRRIAPELRFGYGVSYDRQFIEYRARAISTGSTWLLRQGVADAIGAYGEATWDVTADVVLRAGLRGNLFPAASTMRLAPRVAIAWQVSEQSELSLAAGRYYQYLRVPETILSNNLSAAWGEVAQLDSPVAGGDEPLAVAGANHLVVGLSHEPGANLRLGLEGYYKSFDGTQEVADLRASGADIWIDWSGGDWGAWAGYSLAWAWTVGSFGATNEGFSARHLLSGGLTAPLPSGARFEARLSSSDGIPFTPIPTGVGDVRAAEDKGDPQFTGNTDAGALTGAPAGSYLRLDAQVSRAWPINLFGSEVQIMPYLRVLNALDRRDALFYQFDAGRDLRPRSLEAVPLLPVFGIEWRS